MMTDALLDIEDGEAICGAIFPGYIATYRLDRPIIYSTTEWHPEPADGTPCRPLVFHDKTRLVGLAENGVLIPLIEDRRTGEVYAEDWYDHFGVPAGEWVSVDGCEALAARRVCRGHESACRFHPR